MPTERAAGTGLLSGLTAAEAAAEGLRVVDLPVTSLVPHPFNLASRSEAKPGVGNWDELLQSVAANGVRITGMAVTREAFTTRWPEMLPSDSAGDYVLMYGHRRRAAAIATNTPTMPIVVDDTLLDSEGGGLKAMFEENLGREDLSPLAEARLLAKFFDDAKYSGRELGDMLGLSQPTISRRMNLLLLAPELQDLVDAGEFQPTEAASVGAKLPYGPMRRWQASTVDAVEQASDTRRDDQMYAYRLITEGALATTATKRVLAERASRTDAQRRGVELVDPVKHFGSADAARSRRIYDDVDDTAGLVAAIDEHGGLAFYETDDAPHTPTPVDPKPEHDHNNAVDNGAVDKATHVPRDTESSEPPPASVVVSPIAEETNAHHPAPPINRDDETPKKPPTPPNLTAQVQRTEAAASIATTSPPRKQLLQVLADVVALNVVATTDPTATADLAAQWASTVDDLTDPDARIDRAWTLALAGFELHTRAATQWTQAQTAYLSLLRTRAKYRPTGWETQQLDNISGP